jgi:hypothetical protein
MVGVSHISILHVHHIAFKQYPHKKNSYTPNNNNNGYRFRFRARCASLAHIEQTIHAMWCSAAAGVVIVTPEAQRPHLPGQKAKRPKCHTTSQQCSHRMDQVATHYTYTPIPPFTPPRKVDLSIINGAVVVEAGRLLTLDVEALRLEAAQRAKRVVEHATHPATH